MRGKKAKALRRAANRVPWVEVTPPTSIWARLARWWRNLWAEKKPAVNRPRRFYRLAKRIYMENARKGLHG